MMMKMNRPGPTRLDLGSQPEGERTMLRFGFAALFLFVGMAGCGGGEEAQTAPSKLSLSPEHVEAIKTQDEAIEEEEGGAFKRRVEARSKGKKTGVVVRTPN